MKDNELLIKNTKASLYVIANPNHSFHEETKKHSVQIAKESLQVIELLEVLLKAALMRIDYYEEQEDNSPLTAEKRD